MATEQADKSGGLSDQERNYRRSARLLGQKLGIDWRDLPTEQVIEYMRKIEIARDKAPKTDKSS